MSIEDDIADAFNDTRRSIEHLEDRMTLLGRQLEILAGTLRHAGIITEEHMRQAKEELEREEKALADHREQERRYRDMYLS